MLPGIEEANILKSLDVWRAQVNYSFTEDEARACSDCTLRSARYMYAYDTMDLAK